MIKIKDTDSALLAFEDASRKHAEATEQGNYKLGNKCYATLRSAAAFLKEHNQALLLSQFLSHSSVGVRMWSATYLLPICENESLKVLEQIVEMSGIHSLTAKTTLREWERGALIL